MRTINTYVDIWLRWHKLYSIWMWISFQTWDRFFQRKEIQHNHKSIKIIHKILVQERPGILNKRIRVVLPLWDWPTPKLPFLYSYHRLKHVDPKKHSRTRTLVFKNGHDALCSCFYSKSIIQYIPQCYHKNSKSTSL